MADRKNKRAHVVREKLARLAEPGYFDTVSEVPVAERVSEFGFPVRYAGNLANGVEGVTTYTPSDSAQSSMILRDVYRNKSNPDRANILKHEILHGLQNIDPDPFSAAARTVNHPNFNPREKDVWRRLSAEYGEREAAAYLLSRTEGKNQDLRKALGADDPKFANPYNLLDDLLSRFTRSPRQYDVEALRKSYQSALPIGLQGIIQNLLGNR